MKKFRLSEWPISPGMDGFAYVLHEPCRGAPVMILSADDLLEAVMDHKCQEEE